MKCGYHDGGASDSDIDRGLCWPRYCSPPSLRSTELALVGRFDMQDLFTPHHAVVRQGTAPFRAIEGIPRARRFLVRGVSRTCHAHSRAMIIGMSLSNWASRFAPPHTGDRAVRGVRCIAVHIVESPGGRRSQSQPSYSFQYGQDPRRGISIRFGCGKPARKGFLAMWIVRRVLSAIGINSQRLLGYSDGHRPRSRPLRHRSVNMKSTNPSPSEGEKCEMSRPTRS